jgi:hypothetical protein
MKRDSKHKEIIEAWLDGADVEYKSSKTEGWVPLVDPECTSWYEVFDYRLKAKPKVIDLSRLIDSGIDCEFSDSEDFNLVSIGQLAGIFISTDSYKMPYSTTHGRVYPYATPRLDHWMHWDGRSTEPLPDGLMIEWKMGPGPGYEGAVESQKIMWGYHLEDDDYDNVTAFRVVGLAEDYKWPWEVQEKQK